MDARDFWRYAGIGVLVGLHWVAFYGAIKLANASVALICMATTALFTALLEPFIVRTPFRVYELLLGLLIIPGMALIVTTIDASLHLGLVVGLVSAFLAALFATLNKRYIGKANPMRITFLELGSAWVFLSIVLAVMHFSGSNTGIWWPPSSSDWVYLALLAFLCTTVAYTLNIKALQHISAFASNLIINLEPVYGIALAWIILGDQKELSPGFYYGVVIILLAVFSYPFLRRKLRHKEAM
ncbi:MAG: DMT family transporter [Saprospiraceae bacterium]